MPDTKITALTALTAADPANDVLPIVDVSDTTMAASGTTKKISINNVLGCSGTATLASATITGNLTVDTNTFFVDSANNRVGIGTATPLFPLDIISSGATTVAVRSTGAVGLFRGYAITDGTTEYGQFKQSLSSGELQIVSGNAGWGGFLTVSTGGSERYRIASDGVATWSNVGGVAGTAMTLNSTGLGIGVTPSAWAIGKVIQLSSASGSFLYGSGGQAIFGVNAYYDTAWKYGGTGAANYYQQSSGIHSWFNAPSGTAGNAITWTQAMTLDASGRLIINSSTFLPPTLNTNGELNFIATSNTNVRFSYRGTDGVTRVANITLA